ncbi:MAG: head morphogenesis protein [Rhodobacterales bacterium 65-51]|uniref:PBECR2 nuclease fold domain-containing protein n=1 Tax=uncultured Gemmobacter sp. TaxID=1095917 RepID=UPI000960EB0B|nr:PBECR2 nuclease fold domain-containing protein [uncultured Gemmobacter sp.]OJY36352.1 MAG: head morphogenesis protein [Rhodobacterales bacterium 65-51]
MLVDAVEVSPLEDIEATISAGILTLAASWTPNSLDAILSPAMELAALEGREAVFAEMDGPAFADEALPIRQEFREQIDFLTQKRLKPTKVWTDAMHGDHDRAFVVAGATNMAMLEEFHAAVIDAARTYDFGAFGKEFDRIVDKYGWSYNGGRNWRVRTIFETNIRTSYMAGRLRQMRDPDLVKIRPYWRYRHADTRVPMNPRPEHVAWNGLVLMHDDPWWDTHFPPNDWKCSCGVETLSRGDLRRLGKSGPDTAPEIVRAPFTHKASGETVMLPEGIGYGWDYQPGNLWERGLVPSALIDEGGGLIHEGRHAAQIDPPAPLQDLLDAAKPFSARPLPEAGLSDEDYVRAFLQPFGADIGRAVLWTDAAGHAVPISEEFFRARDGRWKIGKRGRARLAPLMAEALIDPDEIWLGVAAKPDPLDAMVQELLVDRRYIRVDPELGIVVVMEVGRRWWEPITIYDPTKKNGQPDPKLLDRRRSGKLLWKRK